MKKIILALSFILSLSFIMPVSANTDDYSNASEIVVDTENESIEDYLDKVYEGNLTDGDNRITREALEIGIQYAEEQSNNPLSRSGGEVWTITKTKVVRAHGPLKTKWINTISTSATQSKSFSASFTIKGKVFGHDVTVGATTSKSESFSGPSGTEKVSSYYATHRGITSIARGTITEYTVRITDKYSGGFIRNHTYKAITNANTDLYGNLMTIKANGWTYVRSAISSLVLSYPTEMEWRNKLNNEVSPSHIAW